MLDVLRNSGIIRMLHAWRDMKITGELHAWRDLKILFILASLESWFIFRPPHVVFFFFKYTRWPKWDLTQIVRFHRLSNCLSGLRIHSYGHSCIFPSVAPRQPYTENHVLRSCHDATIHINFRVTIKQNTSVDLSRSHCAHLCAQCDLWNQGPHRTL